MNSNPSIRISPGVRYMLLSTLAFSALHALIKELDNFHITEVIFFRSAISAGLCLGYLRAKSIPMRGNKPSWLLLRALCGMIAMSLFYVTLQRMPMGASVSLQYLSPVFAAILAVLFLKEKVAPMQWLFFLGAFAGVIILKGFDPRIDLLNLFLAITSAIFAGLVYVIIRKIGEKEHTMVIVNYFMLSTAILSGIAMIPFWESPGSIDLVLLLLTGVLGYFGQVLLTKGFQLELASRVAPIRYLEVINSLLVGLVWFGESYSLISLIGIILIVGSMLLNVLYKRG